jgi:hypothetical protein
MSALLRIGIGGEPLKEFYDAVHDLLVRMFLAETTHRDDLVIGCSVWPRSLVPPYPILMAKLVADMNPVAHGPSIALPFLCRPGQEAL